MSDMRGAVLLAGEIHNELTRTRADLAKAQAEVALMSCGHPRVMQDRSVESGVEFCRVCRNIEMLRDALHMEQHYKAECDALKAQVADAEKVLGFVRHPWRIEHIGFTGLYDVVRSPPSGRETLGHGSYPKSIAQTCCDAANREPVDNYDSKWRAGK